MYLLIGITLWKSQKKSQIKLQDNNISSRIRTIIKKYKFKDECNSIEVRQAEILNIEPDLQIKDRSNFVKEKTKKNKKINDCEYSTTMNSRKIDLSLEHTSTLRQSRRDVVKMLCNYKNSLNF